MFVAVGTKSPKKTNKSGSKKKKRSPKKKSQQENQEDLRRYENADADHGSRVDVWARLTLWKVESSTATLVPKDHTYKYRNTLAYFFF